MRVDDRLHQPVQALTGFRRHNRDADSLDLRQQPIDRVTQSRKCAWLPFDQIPFVDSNDDGPPFPLDQIGDPDVLLFERCL